MGRLVKCLLVSVIGWGIASTESASQDNLAIIEPVTPNKVLDGGAVAQTREVASPDEENPYAVVVGDTLKIEIFDRKDLSGSFRVRPDGQISLPLIGCVNVRGKTLSRLEDELAKSVRDVTDHATTVSIETVERPPVYTVGFINKPNAYPYVENMTVLHALALAGGLYRALADSGLPAGDIEASRESAQLNQTLDVLKRSLARLARLRGQRDGKTKVEPDPRLLNLCTKEKADELIAAESRLMQEQEESLRAQLTANSRAIEMGQEEIKALKSQLDSVNSQAESAHKDLDEAARLQQQGLMRNYRVREIQRLGAQYDGESRVIMASIFRAESNIAALSRDRELLTGDRKLKIESEISELEEKVAQSENALRSSKGLIRKYTGMTLDSHMSFASPRIKFTIIRNGDEGRKTIIDATETTMLFPGDIVQFKLADEQEGH